MKPFSFVHAADLHLGYAQYNLDVRREDFNAAFREIVDKTLELKPEFMIVAGDIFQQARPSNLTLEAAIQSFKRLKDAGIPVLTVDGSHDSAPNTITGTILDPLDSAGLIYYLPRHEGACWRNENCYVYGVPNFRTKRRTEVMLPEFLEKNKPEPDPSVFNIFVFHMALDLPGLKPSQMEAEARLEMLPKGFNYYAAGHIHSINKIPFDGSLIVYSGCAETVSYDDAETEKGFYHVEVNEKGVPKLNRIKIETSRRFVILDNNYDNLTPAKITAKAVQRVNEADEEGAVIVPVLRGKLPAETGRGEVNLAKIRNAAKKALFVRPVLLLQETEVSEEIIRSIFEGGMKDLKTKAFEYFFEIFRERYAKGEAEKIAKLAVNLIDPLVRGEESKVKEAIEEFLT